MKLSSVRYQALRVDEVSGFFGRILAVLAVAQGAEKILCRDAFEIALKNYKVARSRERVLSVLGEKDTLADQAWQALNYHLRACALHYDESKRESALRIKAVFDSVPNPMNLNYNQEYGALTTLLGKLDDIPDSVVDDIDARPWIEHLRRRVQDFFDASESQAAARGAVEVGEVKRMRTALFKAWADVKQSIEYMHNIAHDADMTALIQKLNVYLDAAQQMLNQRKNRQAIDGDNGDIQFDQVGRSDEPSASDD